MAPPFGDTIWPACPAGLQTLGGVTFDIRGVVQLAGVRLRQDVGDVFPKQVTGIKVASKRTKLHFLHAAAWPVPDGTPIGHYIMHYADGQRHELPIVYGQDVRDWCVQGGEPAKDVSPVWRGTSADAASIRLYKTTWSNPRPDVEITSIDYVSAMTDSAPFLIAITAE